MTSKNTNSPLGFVPGFFGMGVILENRKPRAGAGCQASYIGPWTAFANCGFVMRAKP
jgi:hypothetical protein